MGTIRIETDGAGDLSQVYRWFARHRGGVVELDQTRRLALGIPITGARAVIVAVTLQDQRRPRPELGGVVRAISNRTNLEPVRLVFEGRSPAGLPRNEAEAMATEVLAAVSRSMTTDDLVERVA
ncbi:MAG TPA: hypothetical protein VGE99_01250 [Candidatus Dormibacteraeota bacterium]